MMINEQKDQELNKQMIEIKKKIKNLCEQLDDKNLKQVLFEVRKKDMKKELPKRVKK